MSRPICLGVTVFDSELMIMQSILLKNIWYWVFVNNTVTDLQLKYSFLLIVNFIIYFYALQQIPDQSVNIYLYEHIIT